jgi:hypothetical protein
MLSGLTNLTELDLEYNQISDISVLSWLTNLRHLDLDGNQISDISALSGLTNLESLRLVFNQISDISDLSGLTRLSRLILFSNPLNVEAYCTYLQLIEVNNPGINLDYDPNPYPDCDEDGVPDACDEDSIDNYPPGGNGCDDACECHADCDDDQMVYLSDLVIMKQEFLRTDCATDPCEADCNYDGSVDLSDLVMMKTDFFRSDCPICP